ncbi:MAG TPA: PadR family transcriptional regulator [Chloroflexia bacterium]|nr:PadR family transcriptional regulator [Chloroflexia bacterium]
MKNTYHRSSLALTVLALLAEEAMHPYRMQQLIKDRGKDQVVNVRERTSIYQTIERLLRAGLIAVRETAREERHPERTVYELTAEGRRVMQVWMREMLSTPRDEFPDFPAALAFLPLLAPDDALRQLETRADALGERVARMEADLQEQADTLPRLFLLEEELMHATLAAELEWVRALLADLRAGRLTWTGPWLDPPAGAPSDAGDLA